MIESFIYFFYMVLVKLNASCKKLHFFMSDHKVGHITDMRLMAPGQFSVFIQNFGPPFRCWSLSEHVHVLFSSSSTKFLLSSLLILEKGQSNIVCLCHSVIAVLTVLYYFALVEYWPDEKNKEKRKLSAD